jgi:hypothetical protein
VAAGLLAGLLIPSPASVIAAVTPRSVPRSAPAAAAPATRTPTPNLHRRRAKDPSSLQSAKAAADARAAAFDPAFAIKAAATFATTGTPAGPSSGTTSVPGLGSSTIAPSDSTGDVGDYVVYPGLSAPVETTLEIVNGRVGLFNSPGCPSTGCESASLNDFAGRPATDCVFDPQIQWDQQWGRWIYSMTVQVPNLAGQCTSDSGSPSTSDYGIAYGFSVSGNPSPLNPPCCAQYNWCHGFIDTKSFMDDFPRLGHDNNFITIGANVYPNFGQDPFLSSVIWAIPKPTNIGVGVPPCGSPPSLPTQFGGTTTSKLMNSDGSLSFTPVPADMTESSATGYIVSAVDPGPGTASKLMVWRLTSSSGTPALTPVGMVNVPTYSVPADVPQPSTGTASCATSGNCLDSGDTRLTQVIARYDPDAAAETLWTQHAVTDPAVGTMSVERWYELVPGAATPRQTGNVSSSSLYIFNGSMSPASVGNEAVMYYNAGSAAAGGFASWRAQSRNKLSPAGTLANEIVLATSPINDYDYTCGISQTPATAYACRWGDYSGAKLDPLDANRVWGFGMLANGGVWTTQISSVTPGCTAVSESAAPAGGNLVTFTASGTTGCSNPQYEFWLQPATSNALTLKQAFGGNASWTWDTTGYAPGFYAVELWANQLGDSQANAESFYRLGWTVPPWSPCTNAGLTTSPASPQVPGGTVQLTASSSTCTNPLYAFWMQAPGSNTWQPLQGYSTSPTFAWHTAGLLGGAYNLMVRARDSMSAGIQSDGLGSWDSSTTIQYTLTTTPCSSVTASAAPPAQSVAGTQVTITGIASGCPSPLYRFWMLAPGASTWQLVQDYSAGPSFIWNTAGSAAGTYRFSTWVRDSSSAGISSTGQGSFDAFVGTSYTLTPAVCSAVSLSAAPASTATAGTSITVTASATCPNANPRFEFLALWASTNTWIVQQPYSTGTTWTWNSTGAHAGIERFGVWVKDAASSNAYDQVASIPFTVTTLACTAVSITASPASPQASGTTITVTATSTCPDANPQYQFLALWAGINTWIVQKTYSTSTTWTWNSTGAPPGTERFGVWVRDASSGAAYDAVFSIPYQVT